MQIVSLEFREKPVQSVAQRGASKFVQLSFEPGQGITKHRAPLALAVVVLTGTVRFSVGDDAELLHASEMVMLDPNVEHAIEGVEKSTVLLVLTPLASNDSAGSEEAVQVSDPGAKTTVAAPAQPLEHQNAYQNPALLDQIAPEIRPLVDDHIEVCRTLETVKAAPQLANVKGTLRLVGEELSHHFVVEENALFPRMAAHVGGIDVGPVARLLAEHQHIRNLHQEAELLLSAFEELGDEHVRTLLTSKVEELSRVLLNHLGKEDSHLFPMASRLLTAEEKSAVAAALSVAATAATQARG